MDLQAPEFAAFRRRRSRSAVLRRRRIVFRNLLGTLVTTVVAALFFAGWVWWLAGVGATLLVAYTLLLIRLRWKSELRHRVRHLPERDEESGDRERRTRAQQRQRAVEG